MITVGEIFHLILIKPTRYDNQGYPAHWRLSTIPSNSLACLYGIACDAADRNILGSNVTIRVRAIDEVNERVSTHKLIKHIKKDGGKCLIGFVGVQSNQFPRMLDLAKDFVSNNIPVVVGGFHVSGSLSMLPKVPVEIQKAMDLGIGIFTGEAEDRRFDQVLQDAYDGKVQSLYDYNNNMPDLQSQPLPFLPPNQIKKSASGYGSFDLGRGCPFQCSFCCIINVQGRVSRHRTTDDLEQIVRKNYAIGVTSFFITDDNLARNRNWEAFFDRIIRMRRKEGIKLRFIIQVDTLCHRTPNFIKKAVAAGVDQVFIGFENINPDNLLATGKRQNHITEYREMLLAWKKYQVVIIGSFITGFPTDTKESILRDIEIIKRELPIDAFNPAFLTPLPGSADHKKMLENGDWMDPDLNDYDIYHRVTHHPVMSDAEWESAWQEMFQSFYTMEHMETILRRMVALGSGKRLITIFRLVWYSELIKRSSAPSLDAGIWPVRHRRDRRPGMKLESIPVFWYCYLKEAISITFFAKLTFWRLRWKVWKIEHDPKRMEYVDDAIRPAEDADFDKLELFSTTRGGAAAIAKQRRINAQKKKSA